jgi:hypothetical protein
MGTRKARHNAAGLGYRMQKGVKSEEEEDITVLMLKENRIWSHIFMSTIK